MVLKEKDPFDNRKFILPSSRYVGSPPWSSRSSRVTHAAANVPQESLADASPSAKFLKLVWNSKVQLFIHSTIIFVLLSSAGMEVVSSYQISPPLRYIAQIICQHDPTGYLQYGCDLIALAPSGPASSIAVSFSSPALTPRRNFAAHRGGATILREYTSITHGGKPCIRWPFVLLSCELENLRINSPNIALEEGTEEGDCWELSGSVGQLAFNLSASVSITEIGLDYPDPSLLSQSAHEKTPQDLSVWVLVEGSDLRNMEVDQIAALHPTDFVVRRHPGRQTKSHATFVRIAQFKYNPSSTNPTTKQFFNTSNLIPKVFSQTVIIRVESNYGAPTTCLYWVGVFGEIRAQHR